MVVVVRSPLLVLSLLSSIGSSILTQAQTVTIDNDVPEGTAGYWAVFVETGGQSDVAVMTAERATTGDLVTEDVVFDYHTYVDIGFPGEGLRLLGTDPIIDPVDPDTATSSGSFIGANGNTINWVARSWIPDGERTLSTAFTFSTTDGAALGQLRLFQYLDEDVEYFGDDVFFTKGTIVGRNLELFTMDGFEVYGVSQSGGFDDGSGLADASFVGWAVDIYPHMTARIEGDGQQVSLEGFITDLATYDHNQLGTVLGPADVVSALAWEVNPTASDATILTTLGGVPDIGSVFEPPVVLPPHPKSIVHDTVIDPTLPTIVVTHGWQIEDTPPEDLWSGFGTVRTAGSLLRTFLGGGSANIIQYIWKDANTISIHDLLNGESLRSEYILARQGVHDAGQNLAMVLQQRLGFDYGQPVHFIGHSLGTAVNAYAARAFLSNAPNVTTAGFTILDYPDRVEKIPGMTTADGMVYGC